MRRWDAERLAVGVTPVTAAKAYRLLKSIMATAVDDGLIRRNPYRIKAAGIEKSAERPVLTVAQVYALADAVGTRYRALVLLACFCGLRWGEMAALRRSDIDINAGTVLGSPPAHRGTGPATALRPTQVRRRPPRRRDPAHHPA